MYYVKKQIPVEGSKNTYSDIAVRISPFKSLVSAMKLADKCNGYVYKLNHGVVYVSRGN